MSAYFTRLGHKTATAPMVVSQRKDENQVLRCHVTLTAATLKIRQQYTVCDINYRFLVLAVNLQHGLYNLTA